MKRQQNQTWFRCLSRKNMEVTVNQGEETLVDSPVYRVIEYPSVPSMVLESGGGLCDVS